jgi:chemotaxis protein MotB
MRWLLTYADMITLLLAFFVILYAISKVDAKKYEALSVSVRGAFGAEGSSLVGGGSAGRGRIAPARDAAAPIVEQLQKVLAEDLAGGRIQIERSARGVLIRFQDTLFFERGKAELNSAAQRILREVAAVIAALPNDVEAEGHTDSLPIRSAQFPSNWELSVARSTAVVRYLVEEQGISPLRLSARGLGEHKPLFQNHPTLGEPRNRRVELTIVTRG